MEDFGSLIAIAEVAVAFAGFSALAGVISGSTTKSAIFDLERLRTVVFTSLLAVGCALIPVVVNEFVESQVALWQISSAIAFVLNLAVLINAIRTGGASQLHQEDKIYTWAGYGIEVPIEITVIAGALNLFPKYGAGLYLAFLLLLLFQSGLVFLLLITSIISGQRQ